MNAWIILLFLLARNNSGSCGCDGGFGRDRDCGCDGDSGRDRDCDCDRDRGRDRGRDRDGDCDNNGSRFEPRFDARPFGDRDRDRETCGCEENNN